MKLIQNFLTENECYQRNVKIEVKGLMLHSTGANNPNLKRYVQPNIEGIGTNANGNHWNQFRPDGRQVCVHGFIGKLENGDIATVQTLPWDMKGWHAGSTANNTHIGVEICEDDLTNSDYFTKVYNEAVELFAYLCKQFNLTENDIICHCEGYQKGIASNHSDVMHWFPKHGKSMDTFRADVKAKLNANTSNETQGTIQTTKSITDLANEVIAGKYGVGEARKRALGSLYNEVQAEVNRIMKGTSNKTTNTYLSNTSYKGSSIVDALNQIGVDSSFEYRKKLAVKNNIKNYSGTALQNNRLLDKLKAGKLIKA